MIFSIGKCKTQKVPNKIFNSGPHMPIGNICSGISFRCDDSIFVALAEPCFIYSV